MSGPTLIVMGSGAGGGVPQWNCACAICALARAGDPRVSPRTQAQIVVGGDDGWVLIGASPDLRQQILATPELAPRARRDSPITGVVLISADIDGVAGLLTLRERQPFRLLAPASILAHLDENGMFGVLDPSLVSRESVAPEAPFDCAGLSITLLTLPGKTPLYGERQGADELEEGPAYAARIDAGGRRAVIAPACARLTPDVVARLGDADLLLFDGTVFEDAEMSVAGVGAKTGRRMGHVPLVGAGGSLAQLATTRARKVLFHINNTNPILDTLSAERRAVEDAGFAVAFDGMRLAL